MILIENVFYNFGKGGDKTMGKITAYKVNNLSKVDLRFYKEGDHFITSRSVGMLTNGKMKILQSDLMNELNDLKNRVKALEEVSGRNLFTESSVQNGYFDLNLLTIGHTYTLSSDKVLWRVKISPDAKSFRSDSIVFLEDVTQYTFTLTEEMKSVGKLHLVKDGSGTHYTYDELVNMEFKLVKDIKATDWTPAPEDL